MGLADSILQALNLKPTTEGGENMDNIVAAKKCPKCGHEFDAEQEPIEKLKSKPLAPGKGEEPTTVKGQGEGPYQKLADATDNPKPQGQPPAPNTVTPGSSPDTAPGLPKLKEIMQASQRAVELAAIVGKDMALQALEVVASLSEEQWQLFLNVQKRLAGQQVEASANPPPPSQPKPPVGNMVLADEAPRKPSTQTPFLGNLADAWAQIGEDMRKTA